MRIYTFHGPNNFLGSARTKEGAYEKWVEAVKATPTGAAALRAQVAEIYSFVEIDEEVTTK